MPTRPFLGVRVRVVVWRRPGDLSHFCQRSCCSVSASGALCGLATGCAVRTVDAAAAEGRKLVLSFCAGGRATAAAVAISFGCWRSGGSLVGNTDSSCAAAIAPSLEGLIRAVSAAPFEDTAHAGSWPTNGMKSERQVTFEQIICKTRHKSLTCSKVTFSASCP